MLFALSQFCIRDIDAQNYFLGKDNYPEFSTWTGKTMRVHGWIQESPAAHIELVYPEQMTLFAAEKR